MAKSKTNVSVNVLNAIRNTATQDYRNYVPYAKDGSDIKAIGAIIMDNVALYNEFCHLINRIAEVKVVSKLFQNPLRAFKQGKVDFGTTVEEAFVELATVKEFDYDTAQNELFKIENPDIRVAFHPLNSQKVYKQTLKRAEVRKAFLSETGVADLAQKIIESIYTAVNYDEYETMKYMLAKAMLAGQIKVVPIEALTDTTVSAMTETILETSDNFVDMSPEYNLAGVRTHSAKDEQYLIINNKANAKMNVGVLATAFNMDKAEFMGHKINITGFGKLDIARLNELYADQPGYEEIGSSDLEALATVAAVLLDKGWFQVWDNMLQMAEADNQLGLYNNYFYHVWKTFSVSPFANAVCFTSGDTSVTSVTISPSEATIPVGGELQLTASLVAGEFANKAVVWTSDSDSATVDIRGVVKGVAEGEEITITATSVEDGQVAGTATITVGDVVSA